MPRVTPQGPEGTIWFGGHPDEARLCLRMCGNDLDPGAISAVLGCAPSRCQTKGEPVLLPSGKAKRIARIGSWLLDRPVGAQATIAEAIMALIGSLPADKVIWKSLTSGFKVDLICDVTVRCVNRGFELSPNVLELLAERGITLGFDIFCEMDPSETGALHERLRETLKG